jgi:hypothetical protein
MPNNKIRPKWIKLPPAFRDQLDLHYGTWVNLPYLRKLIDSPEFWQKRYHDLAEQVFKDWKLTEHLLINRKPTGRPKEDNDERDRRWLEQMTEYVEHGMSRRKASKMIANIPPYYSEKTVLNTVNRLMKEKRRADAVTPAQR